MAPDGSLVGVQINPAALLRGGATLTQLPLATPDRIPLGEPLSFQLGEDGNGYAIAVVSEQLRDRQSVLTVIDPATGGRGRPVGRSVQFFGRRINTFAALGRVAADRTRPEIRVRLPRRISARALLARKLPLRVRSDEAAQLTVSLQVAERPAGFAFETRDTPGDFRVHYYAPSARERRNIRAGVGRRLRLRIRIHDLKGNRRSLLRTVRLTR
jgi:hypothetical protein